jgi:hypothetical protein
MKMRFPRIRNSCAQKSLQGRLCPSRATYSVDYGIGDIIEMSSCYLAVSANASGTADVRYHTQNSRLTCGSPIPSQTAPPVIASDAWTWIPIVLFLGAVNLSKPHDLLDTVFGRIMEDTRTGALLAGLDINMQPADLAALDRYLATLHGLQRSGCASTST